MNSKIKHIVICILILGLGVLIGWWLNELYRFADAMRNDIVRPIDSLIFNIDSLKQNEKFDRIDSGIVNAESLIEIKDLRLNFDSIIKDSQNQYLLSLSDNEIQICYGRQFDVYVVDYKLFTKQIEEYHDAFGVHKVDVFIYRDSFIKKYFNKHPEVKELDLVCGKILTNEIKLSQGIEIGMEKSDILGKIFKPSGKFESVSKLTIYDDERGEFWVTLSFQNNKLAEVLFDSDWIDNEIRK